MKSRREVHVLSVARTPFGKFSGGLSHFSAVQLATMTMSEVLRRSAVESSHVTAVYAGVGMLGANVLTATRQALLLGSGLPPTVPSLAVDRACCSGMTAIGLAFKDIRNGDAEVVLCGGFESLSNTPFLWPRQRGARPGSVDVSDPLLLRAEFLDKAIACYTGEEAVKMGIDRLQQDEWAVSSHNRFFSAEESGFFSFERFSVDGPTGPVVCDESPRANASVEALSRLETVYSSPTVTPGNAPGLSDGAAFVMLASGEFIETHDLTGLAQVLDYVQVAGGPTSGAHTPADAIQTLLSRGDLTLEQISRIEINEAFAATPLVSTLSLANGDHREAEKLRRRTNIDGGAVAIGHPLGASGARISMSLVNGLRRDGGGLGVAAICGGYGQGDGLLVRTD